MDFFIGVVATILVISIMAWGVGFILMLVYSDSRWDDYSDEQMGRRDVLAVIGAGMFLQIVPALLALQILTVVLKSLGVIP